MARVLVLIAVVAGGCAGETAMRRSDDGVALAEVDVASKTETATSPAARRPEGAPRAINAGITAGPTAAEARPAPAKNEGGTPTGQARVVIVYTANLTMAVFDVGAGLKAIEALARELGGFPARQSNQTITVRVPAARFQEALDRLDKVGDVTSRDVEAEDLTPEYVDLEMRLKNARSVRARLEQLLTQASKVADAIAIERELERVGGEIERMEGRLRYLQDRAQLSTITVAFSAQPRELVAKDGFKLPFPWLDQLGLGRLLDLR